MNIRTSRKRNARILHRRAARTAAPAAQEQAPVTPELSIEQKSILREFDVFVAGLKKWLRTVEHWENMRLLREGLTAGAKARVKTAADTNIGNAVDSAE